MTPRASLAHCHTPRNNNVSEGRKRWTSNERQRTKLGCCCFFSPRQQWYSDSFRRYTRTHARTHTHARSHAHTHARTHTHTLARTHTHTHTHPATKRQWYHCEKASCGLFLSSFVSLSFFETEYALLYIVQAHTKTYCSQASFCR